MAGVRISHFCVLDESSDDILGDVAIQYATVNMFFDVETEVEEFCGMDYWHNGVQRKRCSCLDQLRVQ